MHRSQNPWPSRISTCRLHGFRNLLRLLARRFPALVHSGLCLFSRSIPNLYWNLVCSWVSCLVDDQWQDWGGRKSFKLVERNWQANRQVRYSKHSIAGAYSVQTKILKRPLFVAYFDQCLGVSHSKHWSKFCISFLAFYSFTLFCKKKHLKGRFLPVFGVCSTQPWMKYTSIVFVSFKDFVDINFLISRFQEPVFRCTISC